MRCYAMIITSVPPAAQIIASAPDESGAEFCRERLNMWVATHGLNQYEEAVVLCEVEEQ